MHTQGFLFKGLVSPKAKPIYHLEEKLKLGRVIIRKYGPMVDRLQFIYFQKGTREKDINI